MLVRPLFDGPVDLIGDVRGEIQDPRDVLNRLGYNRHGEHPQHRRLVFLGDLCDRGPDSLAVIALVKSQVGRGLAQCIAGNHELNVLRGAPKHGNHWIIDDPKHPDKTKLAPCVLADPAMKAETIERGGFGAADTGISGRRAGRHSNRRDEVARCTRAN